MTQQPKVTTDDPIEKLNAMDAGIKPSEYESTSVPDFTENDRPVVVILGGHGLPVEHMSSLATSYTNEMQANVLALNYRGYGQSSSGITCNQSMVEDGVAILNQLLESGVSPERIVLHGYSMGGNTAANVLQAAEAKGKILGGLILDRSMEKLSTGARAMASAGPPELIFSTDEFGNICVESKMRAGKFKKFAWAAGAIAYMLAEKYGTNSAIKGLQRRRAAADNKPATPIVGVFDSDPIGKTSERMYKKRGIQAVASGEGHGGFSTIVSTLKKTHEKSRQTAGDNSDILRLFRPFEVAPNPIASAEPETEDRKPVLTGFFNTDPFKGK
ncbi:MAG: alpha/beta fold hydrolase [Roseobacter sp.]|uniref:alpha/beta hydrolase family protein n=1 Tax=Alphaproteobacteria TaxID=28211 RepID=UPI0032658958